MYADRVLAAGGTKRSIKERLNGDFEDHYSRGRQSNAKRQRQDDEKWKHDLYESKGTTQVSNPNLGAKDLRLKLQRKASKIAPTAGRVSQPGDLREKLSGIMHSQPSNADVPKNKSAETKVVKRSAPPAEAIKEKASEPSVVKKTNQKSESSVAGFLKSLGLEKYSITFQAEEVDMTALVHMTDEDLKALGIPMGPRKKILLSLDSKCQH